MAYFALNGTIWQEGKCIGGGQSIENGVQIRVVVDYPKETVKWYKDGSEIGSAMINKSLLTKNIVPYINMNYPGNQVTFNRRPQNWNETLQRVMGEQKKPRAKS